MDTNQEYVSPEEVLFQKVLKQYDAKNWQQVIALSGQLKGQVEQLPTDKIIQFYDVLGNSLKNEQRHEEALSVFNLLIREYPNTHLGINGLIQVALSQKNWQQMIKLSMIFQKYFPKMWQGYWYEAISRKEVQHMEQAKSLFQHLAQHFPKNILGLKGLIEIAQSEQNWQNVIQWSTSFQQQFPSEWRGYWWKGQAYRNLAQFDAASHEFMQLQQIFPNQHHGLEGMINIAQSKQNWEDVVALSEQFQAANPHMWQGWWWKGQAHRHLKQFDEAAHEFAQLQERFPTQHQGLEGMINVAQSKQDWENMLTLSVQFQAASPNMWQSWWWKGQAHRYLKQFDEAIHEFEQLQQRFPKQHHGLEGVINVAQSQQNWQAVAELAKYFQVRYPHMWQGAWWQIEAMNKLQQNEAVEAALAQFAEKFPEHHPRLLKHIQK